jgi:uncharacterized membrane protein
MNKFSNGYLFLVVLGMLFGVSAVMCIYAQAPTASAVMAVFSFMFLWIPQMFPDNEKYKY